MVLWNSRESESKLHLMIDVRFERGVYLPRQDLWLDPWDAKRFAFVSHAHMDHIALHDEVIVSERTARLMRSRLPGGRTEHVLPFSERRTLRGFDLMLLPAGHIFGSAQCFLFAGDETLLYTGDFKLRPGKSAEQAEWRQADTLIMETTFGLPRYRFPLTERVVEQVVAFCREAIDDDQVPVLLGYSLGKAQEILCSLEGAGLTPMLHGSVYQMTRIYEQFGQSFCKYVRYNTNDVAGKVLICPPSANRSRMLEKIARKLGGETMEGEHAPGPHKIDIANQVVVISVVRERKSSINLIAINRVGISRPATDHRNAFVRNFFQHARSICAGWTDEDFSRDIIHVVAHVFTERLAELFVDAGHLIDGAVQHGR